MHKARALRAALRDIVLADDAHATAAAERLSAGNLWPTAVALSGQWRVTPAVGARLARLGMMPDAASSARIREMTIAATAHRALAVKRSREALAVLDRAGVDAVAIKGVALLAGLYGPRSVRVVGDLDVIVREGAYPAARTALEAAGYVDPYISLERHVADIALSPHLHNVARNLVSADFEVDVHWQFGMRPPPALRTGGIIDRAQRALLGGSLIRIAAPADAMAIAAHHALRGYFSPFEVVKDSYDLAAWWTLGRDAWDLDDVIATARAAEVATALYALWRLVERYNPAHAVGAGIVALDAVLGVRARREAQELAEFCDTQFEGGMRAERTVQVFDGGRLCRALVGNGRRIVTGSRTHQISQPRLARRPFPARLFHATRRVVRVTRELAQVRSYGTYRAVARAQSRHH